jgi:DNA-binding NarL/FixJ family response regulator
MSNWRILLADDHALVRAGLRHLILAFGQFEIVGEAGDGIEVIELAKTLQPDIVVLDLSMPKMRGLEATSELLRVSPASKILVLSMFDRDEYVKQSIRNGARGYLLKDSASEELHKALLQILDGHIYLSPSISRSIVAEWVRSQESGSGMPASGEKSELTEREKVVLKLLAEGHSSKEIASILHISAKTVETHRSHILAKSGLHNLAELIKYAHKKGLVEL